MAERGVKRVVLLTIRKVMERAVSLYESAGFSNMELNSNELQFLVGSEISAICLNYPIYILLVESEIRSICLDCPINKLLLFAFA